MYLERSGYTGNDALNAGQQTISGGRVAILLIGSNGLALDPQSRLVITAMSPWSSRSKSACTDPEPFDAARRVRFVGSLWGTMLSRPATSLRDGGHSLWSLTRRTDQQHEKRRRATTRRREGDEAKVVQALTE